MRVITNTNIIVDDFDYCKNFVKGTFVHFLTHFHADHYFGMSTCWDYGPIYCSEITKKLILSQFPKIPNITALELNKKYTIPLNKEGTKTVDVTLFDANHIPGSVLILFQGYMGTILHTGDMRFKEEWFKTNPILYPPEKANKFNYKCSIHIDELIFDNTYLNPVFNFPVRDKACKMMIDIIEKNKGKRVIIAMGTLGKEEMMLRLSEYFQTLIVIPEKKFKMLEAMEYRTDIFTTNPEEGWIEVIPKKLRLERLEQEKAKGNDNFIMVCIDFLMFEGKLTAPDGINFLVPYSQHSNYPELEKFVKSICPSILRKLVEPYLNFPEFKNRPINNIGAYLGYLKNLKRNGKSTYREFLKKYTNITELSDDYKKWMKDDIQKELMAELGLSENANPDLRRKRKKKGLEAELQELVPGADPRELERQFFYSNREKKQSLADISSHMMAVNQNSSLLKYFGSGVEKKKLQKSSTTTFKEAYALNEKLKATGYKGDIMEYFVKRVEIPKYDPTKDDELSQLMEKFVNSGVNAKEEISICQPPDDSNNEKEVAEYARQDSYSYFYDFDVFCPPHDTNSCPF